MLGCAAVELDEDLGLTVDALLLGLEQLCELPDLVRPEGGDEFTEEERVMPHKERRRKRKQARVGEEEAKLAKLTAGPAAARLAAMDAPPGCWLLAPLEPRAARDPAGRGWPIDWPFVRLA